jgi:hypothetical protein
VDACQKLAVAADEDHIPIDLVVYLGSGPEQKPDEHSPAKVLHTLHFEGKKGHYSSPGAPLDHAQNITYPDIGCTAVPTHPATLDCVTEELLVVASRVPFIVTVPAPLPSHEPTPRPVVPPSGPRDEWDFLKPELLPAPQQTPRSGPEVLPPPQQPDPGVPARTTGRPPAHP